MTVSLAPSPALIGDISANTFSPTFQRYLNAGLTYSKRVTGRNPAIGTSMSDVWGYPSTTHGATQLIRTLPTVGFTLAVCSDSAADTGAGTGARTVLVQYLDTNGLPWVATYTLNGQTAVTVATSITAGFLPGSGAGGTVSNALSINDMVVLTAGSGLANAGNIYVFDSSSTVTAGVPQTTTKVFACAMAGDNTNATAAYTIPSGYLGALTMGITGLQTVGTSNVFGKMILQIDNNGNQVFVSTPINNVACNCAPSVVQQNLVSILPGLTNFRIQVQTGATGAEAVAVFNLLLWPAV